MKVIAEDNEVDNALSSVLTMPLDIMSIRHPVSLQRSERKMEERTDSPPEEENLHPDPASSAAEKTNSRVTHTATTPLMPSGKTSRLQDYTGKCSRS